MLRENENRRCFRVRGITEHERDLIYAYLQGAVYCWCKNRKDEWFSARLLVGGDNRHWRGTPAIALYNYFLSLGNGENYAEDEAGKALGWLLKRVIVDDKRRYETRLGYKTREYRWINDEEDNNHVVEWFERSVVRAQRQENLVQEIKRIVNQR